jgi:2-polyprenyl-6-methoxyphenol hydroxylase-like FAD-dependent oxidoreductase
MFTSLNALPHSAPSAPDSSSSPQDGLHVLDQLGVLPLALQRGSRVDRLFGATRDGRPVLDVRCRWLREDLSGLGVHRAMLVQLLLNAASHAGAHFHEGSPVLGLSDLDQPRLHFHNRPDWTGDLCIIASGARSLLRRHPGFGIGESEYSWGALWTIAPDPKGDFAGVLSQVYDGQHHMVGFLPSGMPSLSDPDACTVSMFWSIRLSDIPSLLASPVEAWKSRVLRFAPAASHILNHVRSWNDVAAASYLDVRLDSCWSGRTVVIGDAAHAMSPQLGQGANLALMDAFALALHLAPHNDPADNLRPSLAAFADARHRHNRFYQFASRLLTPVFQGDCDSIGSVRDTLMHPLSRLPWLRHQFLESLVGVKTGIFTSLPLPKPTPSE